MCSGSIWTKKCPTDLSMEFWPDWQVPLSGVIGYLLHLISMFLYMAIDNCQFGTEMILSDLKDTYPPMHLSSDKSTVVSELSLDEEELVAIQESDPDSGGVPSLGENVGNTSAAPPSEDVVSFHELWIA